jgi:hypothetical protein
VDGERVVEERDTGLHLEQGKLVKESIPGSESVVDYNQKLWLLVAAVGLIRLVQGYVKLYLPLTLFAAVMFLKRN